MDTLNMATVAMKTSNTSLYTTGALYASSIDSDSEPHRIRKYCALVRVRDWVRKKWRRLRPLKLQVSEPQVKPLWWLRMQHNLVLSPLYQLPDEMLLAICRELKGSDVYIMRQTCSNFRRILSAPEFVAWEKIRLYMLGKPPAVELPKADVDWQDAYERLRRRRCCSACIDARLPKQVGGESAYDTAMLRLANQTKYCTECRTEHPLIMFSKKQREAEGGAICIMAEVARYAAEPRRGCKAPSAAVVPALRHMFRRVRGALAVLGGPACCDLSPARGHEAVRAMKLSERKYSSAGWGSTVTGTQGALCVQWTMPFRVHTQEAVAAGLTSLNYRTGTRASHGAEKVEKVLFQAAESGYNDLLCPHTSFDNPPLFHDYLWDAFGAAQDFEDKCEWENRLDPVQGFVQQSNKQSWVPGYSGLCRTCSRPGYLKPLYPAPQQYEHRWIVSKHGLALQRQLTVLVPDLSTWFSRAHEIWLQMLSPRSYGLTADTELQHITWCPDRQCTNGRSWATHQRHLDVIRAHFESQQRCKSVPWADLARDGVSGAVVLTIKESRDELRNTGCCVCRLLSAIKPPTQSAKHTEDLRLFSTRDSMALHHSTKPSPTQYTDSRCLAFSESSTMSKWPDGFLTLSVPLVQPDYDVGALNAKKADFKYIQQCLAHCRQAHGRRCNAPVGPAPSNLRVIDCYASPPQVVPAPSGCQYAALSYVWGSPQSLGVDDQMSGAFPRVVKDAILATIFLQRRYLWVDRYTECIHQENTADKHQQIQQMGEIYSHAEITLLASNGANASCGLAGLGSLDRHVRARQTVCGATFQECARHVSHFIKDSAWATRGWTFQESFLSRRRVIFTESEVSFLCNCMHFAESWRAPLGMMEMISTIPFEGLTLPLYTSYGSYKHKPRADMINACLEQYATRKLTYPSDALDACTGVLKRLGTDKEMFISGLLTERELLTSTSLNYDNIQNRYLAPYFLADRVLFGTDEPSVHSRSKNKYIMCMAWYHKDPSPRRSAFPSWSFLGWDGPATMGMPDSKPTYFYPLCEEETFFVSFTPSLEVEPQRAGTSGFQTLHIRGFLCKMLLYCPRPALRGLRFSPSFD
ncbi:hypothetical protein PG988_006160 [Apiospora saccharicola]